MYGLSAVLNVTASVVALISCLRYISLEEVLQYTVYPVMIPFLGMGTDQLAERAVGDPRIGNNVKFKGDDGTKKKAQ